MKLRFNAIYPAYRWRPVWTL